MLLSSTGTMWSFPSGSGSGLQLGASIVSSATIPNSDIVFRRDGAGDRALVFVHGFLDDQYVWNPVIADLTEPGFEIVRLDLAGFGDRTEASGPFTYDRFAADLAAVVDALDKPFVLVGHSMAAPVVELAAAARPGRANREVRPLAAPRAPLRRGRRDQSLPGRAPSLICRCRAPRERISS